MARKTSTKYLEMITMCCNVFQLFLAFFKIEAYIFVCQVQ